ncbi:hypothetical protein [Methylomonas sp. LWB]|uniref:hypothetical protein n=1 Tax=Methylomonas sp. LWB TaxID=1905845 RepID=UPI0011152A75|nr:hypothetical protein [Methylomonas sp. LWB]
MEKIFQFVAKSHLAVTNNQGLTKFYFAENAFLEAKVEQFFKFQQPVNGKKIGTTSRWAKR